jgi:hypothetical protein
MLDRSERVGGLSKNVSSVICNSVFVNEFVLFYASPRGLDLSKWSNKQGHIIKYICNREKNNDMYEVKAYMSLVS